jgi:uncharacterized protein (DUF4415 family)
MVEYDLVKDRANIAKHGLSLGEADRFDWESATIDEDRTEAYGEFRFSRRRADRFGIVFPGIRIERRDRPRHLAAKGDRNGEARMGKLTEYGIPDEENPEWTPEDFARARPAREVLPPALFAALTKRRPGGRGPQKAPTKVAVTLRLDRDVLDRFRQSGPGWQTRINDFLRKAAAGL